MKNIELSCTCGKVQGSIVESEQPKGRRLICYCRDCQTFAHFLGAAKDTLNEQGGTDIYQVAPRQMTISQGAEHLRCVRLSPKGLFRWYTDCCNTPIGNTVSAGIPFVGVVHNFFQQQTELDNQLGPVRMSIQTKDAKGSVNGDNVHQGVPATLTIKTITKLLYRSVTGQGKPTPFFDEQGEPVSTPLVLTKAQRSEYSNQ